MRTTQLLCVILAGIALLHEASGATKCCATTNVNIRYGPSTRYGKAGLLLKGRCLPYRGMSRSRTWTMVTYRNRARYIYKRYLQCSIPPETKRKTTAAPCAIVRRSQWGARSPKWRTWMRSVPGNVYVHHTTGASCSTSSYCKRKARDHQNYHMNTRRWSDIGYSFLIGEDGNVYEGRGWRVVGGHTYGHNSDGYGIAFIGDFTKRYPKPAAQAAFHRLIKCGISQGYLRSNYILKGHRDVGRTACPGNTFYKLVRRWPHYMNSRG